MQGSHSNSNSREQKNRGEGHVEGLAQEHLPELKSMFTQWQDPLGAQHNGSNKLKTVVKLEDTDESGETLSISYERRFEKRQISTKPFLLSQTSTDNSVKRMESTFIDGKA